MSEIITLAKPNQDSPMSLEKAVATRRSRRDFLPQSLTMEQISQLTWAAQGRDAQSRYRTTPSAGATYPLELFVVISDGFFRYLPAKHALEKLCKIVIIVGRGKMVSEQILNELDTGSLTEKTRNKLSKWVNPRRDELIQPVFEVISEELFGYRIERSD
jgi:nitroreductase